jgi:hypothetical protein
MHAILVARGFGSSEISVGTRMHRKLSSDAPQSGSQPHFYTDLERDQAEAGQFNHARLATTLVQTLCRMDVHDTRPFRTPVRIACPRDRDRPRGHAAHRRAPRCG